MGDTDPGRTVNESVLAGWFQFRPDKPEAKPRLFNRRGAKQVFGASLVKAVTWRQTPGQEIPGQGRLAVSPRDTQGRRVDSWPQCFPDKSPLERSQVLSVQSKPP